jgi:acetoin:2,6-dichlorophenolindophenol oxidoreductase subunit beta
MRVRALEAADALAGEGISVEVIDPRTLVPFDADTILASVDRTNRLVVAQEAPHAGSWGATLVSLVMQERFESLDAPPVVVAADDTPIPYAEAMEAAWAPSAQDIADAIRATVAF